MWTTSFFLFTLSLSLFSPLPTHEMCMRISTMISNWLGCDCSSKFQGWIKEAKEQKKVPKIKKADHFIISKAVILFEIMRFESLLYFFLKNVSNFLSVEFDGKTLKKIETMALYTSTYLSHFLFFFFYVDVARFERTTAKQTRGFSCRNLFVFFSLFIFCAPFFALST